MPDWVLISLCAIIAFTQLGHVWLDLKDRKDRKHGPHT